MPGRAVTSKGTGAFADQINADITAKIKRTRERDVRILESLLSGDDFDTVGAREGTSGSNARIIAIKILRLLYFRCPSRAEFAAVGRPPTPTEALKNAPVWLARLQETRERLLELETA